MSTPTGGPPSLSVQRTTAAGPATGTDRHAPTADERPARAEGAPRRWWRRPWILPLAPLAAVFIAFSVSPYLTLDPAQARLPLREGSDLHFPMLVAHVVFGSIALVTCCAQVWPWLRRNHPAVHRTSGRVYVFAGVLPAGATAFVVNYLSTSGMATQTSSYLMAALWLGFTYTGFRMARRRRFAEHREWMIRSFALTLSIVINRFWGVLFMLIALPRLDTVYGGDESA
ncbi:DUF2306 domain-containing protein [Allosalinactinospora lopnorensis]|uniref:DUF2306 domain-containing protein n=1 Tax=Allosalinactinospora lopnorensis TaxID=1352348 RepID=UPI000AD2C28A|nr:DUF2306 domain-containing protein [Allosalinactinospora lopnorensis]